MRKNVGGSRLSTCRRRRLAPFGGSWHRPSGVNDKHPETGGCESPGGGGDLTVANGASGQHAARKRHKTMLSCFHHNAPGLPDTPAPGKPAAGVMRTRTLVWCFYAKASKTPSQTVLNHYRLYMLKVAPAAENGL